MSPRTAAVLLWLGLAFVLPLPLLAGAGVGWWPLAKWAGWAWHDGSLPAALGAIAWGLVLVLVASGYRRWAAALPPKWPGALVGLAVWGILFFTAALPVYRAPGGASTTFMALYGG